MTNLLMKKDNLIAYRAYIEGKVSRFRVNNGKTEQTQADQKILNALEDKIYLTKPENIDFDNIRKKLREIGNQYE